MTLQRRASGELLMTASGALADQCCCGPNPPPADCDWSVSPESLIFDCGAQAGAFNVNVLTGSGCGWSASVTSGGAYLTINSGASGSSSGTVGFDLLSNPDPDRTAQITVVTTVVSPLGPIGSLIGVFDLTQSECSGEPIVPGAPPPPGDIFRWSISPGSATFDCPNQNGFFNVNTQLGGGWAASVISGGSFITIFSGSTGSDAGTVQFNIASNSGLERGGQIEVITTISSSLGPPGTVIGYFNIAQMASSACGSGGTGLAPCNWEITPKNWIVEDPCVVSSLDSDVDTSIGCSWNASVIAGGAFITITSGSSGLSSGTIAFDVAPNSTAAIRFGRIQVVTGAGSVFGPIGTIIGFIDITQHSCGTFIVSQVDGPPLNLFTGGGCYILTNSTAAPVWDNTVTDTGPNWESIPFVSGMGKNFELGAPFPATGGLVTIYKNTPVPGTYSLQFDASPPGYAIIYRKVGGLTPAGLYTDYLGSSNCIPPNPISFLVTPA